MYPDKGHGVTRVNPLIVLNSGFEALLVKTTRHLAKSTWSL